MNLGEKIYECRKKENMSQGDLADSLNVSRQSVSKWETNSSVPELEKLIKISKVFKVSLDELAGIEGMISEQEYKHKVNYLIDKKIELRKMFGFGLLGMGILIFVILFVFSDFLIATILSAPLIISGFIQLLIKKYTGLINGWSLYFLIYLYLKVATSVSVRVIFNKFAYQDGLNATLVIAWLGFIIFGILVYSTYVLIKASKTKNNTL